MISSLENYCLNYVQNYALFCILNYSYTITGHGKEKNTFYLSSNGTDTSTCGKSEFTACKTLEHVLSLYYNTTGQPQQKLNVITSKSLRIDQSLMVSNKITYLTKYLCQILGCIYLSVTVCCQLTLNKHLK